MSPRRDPRAPVAALVACDLDLEPSAVAPIAEVNNYVLPLWLIAMGVILLRARAVFPDGNR